MSIQIIGLSQENHQFLMESWLNNKSLATQISPQSENLVLLIPSPDSDDKTPFRNWDARLTAGWSDCKTSIDSLHGEKSRLIICVQGCDNSAQGCAWHAAWRHFFLALRQEKIASQHKIQVAFLSFPPLQKLGEIVGGLLSLKDSNQDIRELMTL